LLGPATESGTEIIATDLDAYSRMVITYAGNVGIGTTTPSAKLDVVGMISVDNAASGDVLKINNGGYINFNNLARFRAFSTNFQFQDASFNTVAKIAVGGDNSYFNTTGGNVGIGIITPLAKLHVQDTTTLTNPGLFETAYGVNILSQISRWAILTKATNNPQYLGLGNIAGVSSGIQGYTTGNVAGNLSFQPYGGNVGIGTTSPTTLLHLVGSSATINLNNKVGFYGYYGAALAIQPLSSHSTGVLIAAHSTDQNDITKTIFRVTDNTYNTPWFNIIGGGNVGIGTTSPTSKLEVLGTVKSSSEFIITDTTNNLSTRFGALALNSQSSNTSYNSAFGNRALYNLTTGTGNTAVGKDALFNITTSGSNTAVGHQTLQLSVGGANTAVGESSLRNAGGYNASLGYGNANASYSANYGVFLGTDVAKQLTTGQMNIGIGSNTLGQVTTGEKNIAIGYSTGTTSVSGSGNNMNVMAGYYITQVVGSYNNFIGGYAGASSVGNYNSIFGFQAGNKGINGSNNLILGYASGSLISSGANLTSITNSVLIGTGVRASDNGVSNEIVIGGSAIGNGSNSVTLGSDTITKTILKGNIGIGTTSPTYKLDVVGGVRVGNDTIKLGMGESSGDSTFLGSLTNHPLKFLVNTNEYMRIATDGRIGIGITSPTEKLHIKDITGSHKLLLESNNGTSGNSYLTLQGYYSGSNSQLELRGGGSNALITGTGGNEILLRHNSGVNFQNGSSSVSFMRVSSSGVGIGTTSPSYKLSVSDTTNAGIVGSYTNSDGTCTLDPGDGSWSCSSDENLKKDITDSTLGLNELKQLRPVSFRWLSEDPSTSPTLGLIAQEVREIFPNLVHTQIDGKLSLNYGGFTPIIIKSIQDIDLKIEGLNDIDTTNTFRDVIISWLENVSNGIENIFTKKIHTETLCVKKVDGGEVCLNGDELEIIMNGGIISSNTSNIIESNQEQSSNEMETEEFYSESDLVQEVDEINQNGINSDTGDIEENNTDLVSDNEEVEENTNTSFQTNESQNISEQDSVVVLDDSSQ
jgi:hypothetical protein